MKAIRCYIRTISIALMILFSLQSCSVYYSETATMDEALSASNKVKIKTPERDIYKFKQIVAEEDQIYGIAKKKSFTAKDLNRQVIWKKSDEKDVSILLTDEQTSNMHLKNKTASALVTTAVSLVSVGALIGIGYSAADNSVVSISWSD